MQRPDSRARTHALRLIVALAASAVPMLLVASATTAEPSTAEVPRIFYQKQNYSPWQPADCPSDARYHTSYGCVTNNNVESRSTLHSANLDGTDEQPIDLNCTGSNAHWKAPWPGVNKVVVDATNEKIYWENGFEPGVARSDLDGANCELVAQAGYYGKVSIALDDTGSFLYSVQNSTLRRIDTATGTVTNLTFEGLEDFTPASYSDITVANGVLYAALSNVDSAGHIMAVALDTSTTVQPAELLVRGEPAGISSVSVDAVDGHLYWSTGSGVKRALLADGTGVTTVNTGGFNFVAAVPGADRVVMGVRSATSGIVTDDDGVLVSASSIFSLSLPTVAIVTMEVVPETTTTMPETTTTVPESTSTVPESTIPETTTTVRESTIPESTIPESTSTVPGSTIPETTSTLPAFMPLPAPTTTVPESTSPVPETEPSVPGTGSTVPAPTTTVPGSVTTVPVDESSGIRFAFDPSGTIDRTTVLQGQDVSVEAWGFAPDSSVEIWMNSTPQLLATVSADGSGRVSTSVTVPMDAMVGEHTLRLSGEGAAGAPLEQELGLSVVASSMLPATGADLSVPIGAALLVILGFVAVVSTRRPVERI